MHLRTALPATVLVSVALLAFSASAATIGLSTMSSDMDEVNGTPASVLSANLTFAVVGTTLTLQVDNLSNYDITDLYFNSSGDISGLALNQPPTHADWLLGGPQSVSSFGSFDHHVTVTGDINLSGATIMDGTSATLEFSFVCGGVCDMDDFILDGAGGKAVAAKFVNGGPVFDDVLDQFGNPGNDSAFGASPVPEPGTALLLSLGLVGLSRVGRSRS